MDIVKELRSKPSRDNRELLDRAADEIERLRRGHTTLVPGDDVVYITERGNGMLNFDAYTVKRVEVGMRTRRYLIGGQKPVDADLADENSDEVFEHGLILLNQPISVITGKIPDIVDMLVEYNRGISG